MGGCAPPPLWPCPPIAGCHARSRSGDVLLGTWCDHHSLIASSRTQRRHVGGWARPMPSHGRFDPFGVVAFEHQRRGADRAARCTYRRSLASPTGCGAASHTGHVDKKKTQRPNTFAQDIQIRTVSVHPLHGQRSSGYGALLICAVCLLAGDGNLGIARAATLDVVMARSVSPSPASRVCDAAGGCAGSENCSTTARQILLGSQAAAPHYSPPLWPFRESLLCSNISRVTPWSRLGVTGWLASIRSRHCFWKCRKIGQRGAEQVGEQSTSTSVTLFWGAHFEQLRSMSEALQSDEASAHHTRCSQIDRAWRIPTWAARLGPHWVGRHPQRGCRGPLGIRATAPCPGDGE